MSKKKISNNNPFLGITIGSTISGIDGKYSPSVIKEPISVMLSTPEEEKYMSGHSNYVYADSMNQGSSIISGSYGISGISKLNSSLSGYMGQSTAQNNKSVNVDYNAKVQTGIEHINFDDLQASDIIASLKGGPSAAALSSLEKYNEVRAELERLETNLMTVIGEDYKKYDKVNNLISTWIASVNKFFKHYGDGVVVGVVWGAYGTVRMNMRSMSNQSSWKYGGQANFSYSGIGAAVSVKTTYDGSQSSKEADVDVECSSYVSGNVLRDQINKWLDQVINKTYSELADIKVLDEAPKLTITQGPPVIPDFVKPVAEEKVTKEVDKIKNLNGLADFSAAKTFDNLKSKDPELTIDTFIEQANEPASLQGINEILNKVNNNSCDVLESSKHETDASTIRLDQRMTVENEIEGAYAPLGIWISDWASIFPWLATGFMNNIDDIETANQLVKARTMLQDLQTLSNLYYIADWCKLDYYVHDDIPFIDTANSFANQYVTLQQSIDKQDAVIDAFNGLSQEAQTIYTVWNEVGFLRNCELGLGLMWGDRSIYSNHEFKQESYAPYTSGGCKFRKCAFNVENGNYSAFSSFVGVLPLITYTGEIVIFGPSAGVFMGVFNAGSKSENADFGPFSGTSGARVPAKFTFNKEKKVLENATFGHKVVAYPIPYTAAKGIDWKGQSISTNLSTFTALNNQLQRMKTELSKISAWSFSGSDWDEDWDGTDYYSMRTMNTQYIGLIQRPNNIFTSNNMSSKGNIDKNAEE